MCHFFLIDQLAGSISLEQSRNINTVMTRNKRLDAFWIIKQLRALYGRFNKLLGELPRQLTISDRDRSIFKVQFTY